MEARERPRVLLVDDEELFLSSLREELEERKNGFKVLTAMDGRQAIEVAEREPVDLIVTDLKMPQLDGYGLLQYLMRERPGLPVLVMTAFGNRKVETEVRNSGAVGYLDKPVDLEQLVREIELGLHRAARGHLEGITLFSFLQLLHLERKTCTVRVRSEGREGFVYMESGEVVHARCEKTVGEGAVETMASWETPELDIENVCRTRERTISVPLAHLLLETARRHDEAGRGGPFDNDQGDDTEDTEDRSDDSKDDANDAQTHVRIPDEPSLEEQRMANVTETLERAMQINGALGAALVDFKTAMCLGTAGNPNFDLELAAAGNTEVVRAKKKTRDSLGLEMLIEDILITLEKQFHLIRMFHENINIFLYLVLDRDKANLAMARMELEKLDGELEL